MTSVLPSSVDKVQIPSQALLLHKERLKFDVLPFASNVIYIRIDGAGHGVYNEHADRTKPAMEEFFARTLRSRRRN